MLGLQVREEMKFPISHNLSQEPYYFIFTVILVTIFLCGIVDYVDQLLLVLPVGMIKFSGSFEGSRAAIGHLPLQWFTYNPFRIRTILFCQHQ
jgi:hypothetical protein